jgi:hypothetical protein
MAAAQPAFRTVLSRFTMSSKTHRTDGACQRPRDAFHPRAQHRDILVSVTTVPVKRCLAVPARAQGHGQ